MKYTEFKLLLSTMFSFFPSISFAVAYVDAYVTIPNENSYLVERAKLRDSYSFEVNNVSSKIETKMLKKVIYIVATKGLVSVILKNGKEYNGKIEYDFRKPFKKYKVIDPITGKFIENRLPSLKNGSIIEFRSVSEGYRTDKYGNRWPAYYRYSPLTGEAL